MEIKMFRISKDKTKVLDHENRVVGWINNERFIQYGCDPLYRTGLSPADLEKISELMQRNNVGTFR